MRDVIFLSAPMSNKYRKNRKF